MGLSDADLLVVAAPEDELATRFAHDCNAVGIHASFLNLEEAATCLSVHVGTNGALVTPSMPMFYRAQTIPEARSNFDEEFLHWETLAAVWSAAALSDSKVVNRPSVWGISGRLGGTPCINEKRAGLVSRPEIYASDLSLLHGYPGALWVTDTARHSSFALATRWEQESQGPYRARPSFNDPGYEQVIVVGDEAWRTSMAPNDGLELERQSTLACRSLEITFAALLWYVDAAGKEASVAHIDPFPELVHVADCWDSVSLALRRALLS
jgi:hypothetical protein